MVDGPDAVRSSQAKKAALLKYTTDIINKNGFPVVRALDGAGKVVGEMTLEQAQSRADSQNPRTVRNIEVDPAARRQGVATMLWKKAQEANLNPAHSKQRSAEGDAWARKVGGELPKRGQVVASRPVISQAETAQLRAAAAKPVSIRPPAFGANMGLGAANILGFLPMLISAGQIAAGKRTLWPISNDNNQRMR